MVCILDQRWRAEKGLLGNVITNPRQHRERTREILTKHAMSFVIVVIIAIIVRVVVGAVMSVLRFSLPHFFEQRGRAGESVRAREREREKREREE